MCTHTSNVFEPEMSILISLDLCLLVIASGGNNGWVWPPWIEAWHRLFVTPDVDVFSGAFILRKNVGKTQ